jgi:hypothetical protein
MDHPAKKLKKSIASRELARNCQVARRALVSVDRELGV